MSMAQPTCTCITVHELQNLPSPITASSVLVAPDSESQANEAQIPPPQDGGTAAWRLLLSAFVFEGLLWGFPLSFGVFQNYYTQLPQFKDNTYVSVVGTVASGLTYMAAPVIIPFIRRFARWRRRMV